MAPVSLAPQFSSLVSRLSSMPILTLLTDYGTADPYVGELKGVLLTLAASATAEMTMGVPGGEYLAAFSSSSWAATAMRQMRSGSLMTDW